MKRKTELLLLTAVLLGAVTAWGQHAHHAHPDLESLLPPPAKGVVESHVLKPRSGEATPFAVLVVDALRDGDYVIRGVKNGKSSARQDWKEEAEIGKMTASESFVGFEIDLDSGTFETLTFDEFFQDDPESGASQLERLRREAIMIPIRCNCPNPCTGNHTATLVTLDPPGYIVARTNAQGSWYQHPGSCQLNMIGFGSCETPPNPVGTKWYEDYCYNYDSGGGFSIYTRQTGEYHNYDFGLDWWRTDADHRVVISLDHNWNTRVSFTHRTSGEWYFLLRGYLYDYGYNNCNTF